jgi:uncharacterized protein YndB with AHSA1/START domain
MRHEITITRTLDAPRDLVWKAFTEPEYYKRWFGPKEFTTPVARIDPRVGGEIFYCMRSPEGKDYCGKGVYREVVSPERIVVTDSFTDEEGNTVSASYYGMSADWPLELLVTITLEEEDGKTCLTLTHSGLEGVSDGDRKNMEQGWNESFDKLDAALLAWKAERARAA